MKEEKAWRSLFLLWYTMTVFLLCPGICPLILFTSLPGCWESCAWYTRMMSPVSFSQLGIRSIPHSSLALSSTASDFLERCNRLQPPFPLCCGKHNNLVRCKRGKKPQLISRTFCWPLSLQDFNFNPAVNYQLICFAFSLALCSNWMATSVDFPVTKYSFYIDVLLHRLWRMGFPIRGGEFHLNLI